jgi:hypothetical protein
MEYLQLEIGCRGCPLDEPFDPMGEICTDSWVKSFWECVRWFGFTLRVDYPVIPFPRENDLTSCTLQLVSGIVENGYGVSIVAASSAMPFFSRI